MAQYFLQIIYCQQMRLPPHTPLFTPKCYKFNLYPESKTKVCIPSGRKCTICSFICSTFFSLDWHWFTSQTYYPRKGFDKIGMLNSVHISRVYFLHSVGDMGPYEPVISCRLLFPCCKMLCYKKLPPLPVFLRAMFLCQPIPSYHRHWDPKDSLGCVSRKIQACPVPSGMLWTN